MKKRRSDPLLFGGLKAVGKGAGEKLRK